MDWVSNYQAYAEWEISMNLLTGTNIRPPATIPGEKVAKRWMWCPEHWERVDFLQDKEGKWFCPVCHPEKKKES